MGFKNSTPLNLEGDLSPPQIKPFGLTRLHHDYRRACLWSISSWLRNWQVSTPSVVVSRSAIFSSRCSSLECALLTPEGDFCKLSSVIVAELLPTWMIVELIWQCLRGQYHQTKSPFWIRDSNARLQMLSRQTSSVSSNKTTALTLKRVSWGAAGMPYQYSKESQKLNVGSWSRWPGGSSWPTLIMAFGSAPPPPRTDLTKFWVGTCRTLPRPSKTSHRYTKNPGEVVSGSLHKFHVIHTAWRNCTWKAGALCVIHRVDHYIENLGWHHWQCHYRIYVAGSRPLHTRTLRELSM